MKKLQGIDMEMISVISSAISAIGYDKPTQQMRIKFKNGDTVEYYTDSKANKNDTKLRVAMT